MFPLLLDEIAPAFSFDDCNFRVDRSKVKTGRVVVNREYGVANSYTMEISFLGYERGGSMVHFKIEDLQQIGRDFAVHFCLPPPPSPHSSCVSGLAIKSWS